MGQIRLNDKNYSNAFAKKEENNLPIGYTRLIDHAPIARNGNYVTITMPEYYSDYDYIYLVCIEDNYQQDYIDNLFNTHIKYEEDIDTPLVDRVYKMRTDSITHAGISIQVPYLDNEFNYDNNTFTLTITDETITATSNTSTLTDTNLIVIGVHHYDYWLDGFETQSRINTELQLSTQEAFAKDWEIEFETNHMSKNSTFLVAGNNSWNSLGFDLRATSTTTDPLILEYCWTNGRTSLPIKHSDVESTPTTWKFKKVGKTMYLYVNGIRIWTSNGMSNISQYNYSTFILAYDIRETISFGYFGFRWIS